MKTGSLCSGYEGFGLALNERPAWVADIDPDAAKVLAHRFPDVPNLGDITAVEWHDVEPVDVLTAGYPCQPFSHAGKRKGSADERHLWPNVAHAIGLLRPGVCFLENVAGHVSLGLDSVLADLASLGYDATWEVVRASDAGAPHSRARVFVVATDIGSAGTGRDGGSASSPEEQVGRREPCNANAPSVHHGPTPDIRSGPLAWPAAAGNGLPVVAQRSHKPATDASGERHGRGQDSRSVGRVDRRDEGEARERQRPRPVTLDRSSTDWGKYEPAIRRWERCIGRPAPRPTEPGRTGERLAPRFVEWVQGLPDGWVCDVPGLSRNAQLKLLGNGIVPQQAALAWRVLNDLRAAA